MRYERDEMEQAFNELVKNEKPISAVVGAFIGMVPATAFVALLGDYPIYSLVAACIGFPAIAGYFARYMGQLYSPASRIPTALIIGFAYIALGLFFEVNGIWFFVLPIPFGISFLTSRTSLSELQEFAIATHDEKPFEIKVPSRLRRTILPLLVSFSPILVIYIALKPSDTCLTSIERDDYEAIAEACSYNSFQSLAVGYGGNGHKFGTYYQPTIEAKLLRKKAEEGDKEYQIMWWAIYDLIYRHNISVYGATRIETYEQEAQRLRHRAAELGHPPAVQREFELYSALAMKLSSYEEKQEAVKYAEKLLALEIDGAKGLLNKANSVVVEQDIVDSYHDQLKTLDTLTFDELENLLYAVEKGEFYYNLRDFNQRAFDTSNDNVSVNVTVEESKVIDILRSMSERYDDVDASIRVFNLVKDKDMSDAVYYLEKAAAGGHSDSAAKLGKHLFCEGKKLDGLVWIRKAVNLGHEIAKQQQNEIARTDQLSSCN